ASELSFERLEGKQVVPEDEAVVELVVRAHAGGGAVRLARVFEENPRLQPRPVLFADPGEFEFLLSLRHVVIPCVPAPRAWVRSAWPALHSAVCGSPPHCRIRNESASS